MTEWKPICRIEDISVVFGTHVARPMHNWTIGLCDGQASAPDEGYPPKFTVKVEDGAVYLDTAELATMATDLARPIAGRASRTVEQQIAG